MIRQFPRFLLALLSMSILGACKPTISDTPRDPSLSPKRECVLWLTTDPLPNATNVEVAGSFSDWSLMPMTPVRGEAVFERRLGALFSGVWMYKYLVDGLWEELAPDVYTAWEDNVENRALYVGDCFLPSLKALDAMATADGELVAEFQFTRATDGAFLDTASVVATIGGVAAKAEVDPQTGRVVVRASGLLAGKHSLRLSVMDERGRSPEEGPIFLPLWVEEQPFAWSDGLMYFVFVDRFRDGGDSGLGPDGADYGGGYMGGDLVGAKQAMESGWFEQLGVKSIWLSPLQENPETAYIGADGSTLFTGYHGYWPVRSRDVEDRFGTVDVEPGQALKDFIAAAHERGIRVLLDSVLNHVHEDHAYVESHPQWFGADPCVCTTDPGPCNFDSNPVFCWFTDYLPDIDYRNPELVNQFVDDLKWWVESYDIDGFRVDAAKHMHHVIMRTLSLRFDELYTQPGGAPIYMIGETFTGRGGQDLIMDYVAPWELDGQFDFPLYWALREGIGAEQGFDVLASELAASEEAYGPHLDSMSPFMGNHDLQRYATEIGGCDNWAVFGGCTDILAAGDPNGISPEQLDIIHKMSMSFAVVATLPGVPLLYYGDELGLAGAQDPDNRRLMPWTNLSVAQRALLDRIRGLGRKRATLSALQGGVRLPIYQDNDLWIYARDAGNGDSALVVLYMGESTQTQQVYVPTALDMEGKSIVDQLGSGRSFLVSGGRVNIEASPWEYLILAAE